MRESTLERDDHAGLFVVSSDIAVEVVNMPLIFFTAVAWFMLMVGPWLSHIKTKNDQQRRTSIMLLSDLLLWEDGMDDEERLKTFIKKNRKDFEEIWEQVAHFQEELYEQVYENAYPRKTQLCYQFFLLLAGPLVCCCTCRHGSKYFIDLKYDKKTSGFENCKNNWESKRAWMYSILVGDDHRSSLLEKYTTHFKKGISEKEIKKSDGKNDVEAMKAAASFRTFDKENPGMVDGLIAQAKCNLSENEFKKRGTREMRKRLWEGSRSKGGSGPLKFTQLEKAYYRRILANYSWKLFISTYATTVVFLCFFAWLGVSVWLFFQQLALVDMDFELGAIVLGTPIVSYEMSNSVSLSSFLFSFSCFSFFLSCAFSLILERSHSLYRILNSLLWHCLAHTERFA